MRRISEEPQLRVIALEPRDMITTSTGGFAGVPVPLYGEGGTPEQ